MPTSESCNGLQPIYPSSSEIGYEPLREQIRPRSILLPRPDIELEKYIALMGACGDPNIVPDYRPGLIAAVRRQMYLQGLGDLLDSSLLDIEDEVFYSPNVKEWHPGLLPIESRRLARSALTVGPVTDATEGYSSAMEDGFRFARSVFTGQEALFYIEHGSHLNESVRAARQIGSTMINHLIRNYPVGAKIVHSMDELASAIAASRLGMLQQGLSQVAVTRNIAIGEKWLANRVVVSGTGTESWDASWQGPMQARLAEKSKDFSTVRNTWNERFHKEPRRAAEQELREKLDAAINVVVIEGSRPSYGAVVDLAGLVAYTMLHSGRQLGVYMEEYTPPTDSPPVSGQEDHTKAANRQRSLFMGHLGRLFMDFEWLEKQILVAHSKEELETWAIDRVKENNRIWR